MPPKRGCTSRGSHPKENFPEALFLNPRPDETNSVWKVRPQAGPTSEVRPRTTMRNFVSRAQGCVVLTPFFSKELLMKRALAFLPLLFLGCQQSAADMPEASKSASVQQSESDKGATSGELFETITRLDGAL